MTSGGPARRASLWAPVAVYMAVIFYLSSQTDPLPLVTSVVWDKALHFGEYAGLAMLCGRAFSGEGVSRWSALILGALAASLYGLSDETHQSWVAGRQADVYDWLDDSLGGTIGAAFYLTLKRSSQLRS